MTICADVGKKPNGWIQNRDGRLVFFLFWGRFFRVRTKLERGAVFWPHFLYTVIIFLFSWVRFLASFFGLALSHFFVSSSETKTKIWS